MRLRHGSENENRENLNAMNRLLDRLTWQNNFQTHKLAVDIEGKLRPIALKINQRKVRREKKNGK